MVILVLLILDIYICILDMNNTYSNTIQYWDQAGNAPGFPVRWQVVDLPLALGGLGYYPDQDAIREHLLAIGARESEECLTPEELARFLQKYRQVSLGLVGFLS